MTFFVLLFIFLPLKVPEGNEKKKEVRIHNLFVWVQTWTKHNADSTKCQQNIRWGNSKLTIQLWLKKFHSGDLSLKSEECQGRLLVIDIIKWGFQWRLTCVKLSKRWCRSLTLTLQQFPATYLISETCRSSTSGLCTDRMKVKEIAIMKCALCCFLKTNRFPIELWCAMKSGSYTETADNRHSSFAIRKCRSTSQSESCIKRRLWSLFGDLHVVSSTKPSWI
jgi:hypothetical protein